MVSKFKQPVKRKQRTRQHVRHMSRMAKNKLVLRDSLDEIFAGLIWLG